MEIKNLIDTENRLVVIRGEQLGVGEWVKRVKCDKRKQKKKKDTRRCWRFEPASLSLLERKHR